MSLCDTPSPVATSALNLYRHCSLCEHRCGVDRTTGERGRCLADDVPRVWRDWADHAEERPLSPSLLIYLSGCDLRCDFCISEQYAVDPRLGMRLTSEWLSHTVEWGIAQGVRTLQWIGGEPTIHAPAIVAIQSRLPRRLPVVWKSDFYGTLEVWDLLADFTDIYVADFKFGNDTCARRIAGVDRYVEVVTRNLAYVAPRGQLYVRHLLLPGHESCCLLPILAWLGAHLPDVPLCLRPGYLPRWQANRHAELARPLELTEARRARALAADHGLTLID